LTVEKLEEYENALARRQAPFDDGGEATQRSFGDGDSAVI
jgi:hypothetical protein